MKTLKKILNDKFVWFNKYDFIIFIVFVLFCSFYSFQKLGNYKSPNTFYRFSDDVVIVDLKKQTDINKIMIFNGELDSDYDLYVSDNNDDYELLTNYNCSGAFSWDEIKIKYNKVRYIKLDFYNKASIGEIGVYDDNGLIKDTYITNSKKMITKLNDEQEMVPVRKSYMNSSYFDEVYFARCAYEYIHNINIYEWTHPPLGKLIQAIPIYITGNMAPFTYRFMGCLAGILLIGVMYLFGTLLFKKRIYGIYSALIMMLDTFRFAHTRMGTVDSHLVLFITLSIFMMYCFINNSKIRYLFLSGLFFALSISVKWTGLYSGFALAIIYFYYLFKNKKIGTDYIIYGFLFFFFMPIFIYCSIYLKFNNNLYKTNSFENIIKVNREMYKYHSKLKDTHPFSSKWYSWPISYKPVWYHQLDLDNSYQETISGVGNIVIWYTSILGVIYLILISILKRDKKAMFLLLIIGSLWLPYIFINRIMYLYHFFPVLPFFFLASIYFVKELEDRCNFKKIFTIYLLLSTLFFIIYYPVVSGVKIDKKYTKSLEIYKSWYF